MTSIYLLNNMEVWCHPVTGAPHKIGVWGYSRYKLSYYCDLDNGYIIDTDYKYQLIMALHLIYKK